MQVPLAIRYDGEKHMRIPLCSALASLVLTAALASPTMAQIAAHPTDPDSNFAAVEAQQNAANAQAGPRTVPGRSIPVPGTVSPELRADIAAPYRLPNWNANPKSAAEWKELIAGLAARGAAAQPAIREKLGVTMEPTLIGGVKAFILAPKVIPPAKSQPAARPRARRRLRLQSWRGGDGRRRVDGSVWRLQGNFL
jgi:monoterpene epsilon-lactone hydrolase